VNLIVLKKRMLDLLQAKSNNKWKWYYNLMLPRVQFFLFSL
jgi:hypothetical protein